jgi:hypothetical protein
MRGFFAPLRMTSGKAEAKANYGDSDPAGQNDEWLRKRLRVVRE